jgi:hypothetical protein
MVCFGPENWITSVSIFITELSLQLVCGVKWVNKWEMTCSTESQNAISMRCPKSWYLTSSSRHGWPWLSLKTGPWWRLGIHHDLLKFSRPKSDIAPWCSTWPAKGHKGHAPRSAPQDRQMDYGYITIMWHMWVKQCHLHHPPVISIKSINI